MFFFLIESGEKQDIVGKWKRLTKGVTDQERKHNFQYFLYLLSIRERAAIHVFFFKKLNDMI